MTFWTWAKGLEDAFDATNRRNLRRFIVSRDEGKSSAVDLHIPRGVQSVDDDLDRAPSASGMSDEKAGQDYYYMAHPLNASAEEERKALVRINTCAVFYKLSAGVGVPHSFVGFIRQWPALPRVVVRARPTHLFAPRLTCVRRSSSQSAFSPSHTSPRKSGTS
jgi:KUP system potassium uptake protein